MSLQIFPSRLIADPTYLDRLVSTGETKRGRRIGNIPWKQIRVEVAEASVEYHDRAKVAERLIADWGYSQERVSGLTGLLFEQRAIEPFDHWFVRRYFPRLNAHPELKEILWVRVAGKERRAEVKELIGFLRQDSRLLSAPELDILHALMGGEEKNGWLIALQVAEVARSRFATNWRMPDVKTLREIYPELRLTGPAGVGRKRKREESESDQEDLPVDEDRFSANLAALYSGDLALFPEVAVETSDWWQNELAGE